MKVIHLLLLTCMVGVLPAQQPTPPPKKDPFEGFGNTSLNQRPATRSTPSLPGSPNPLTKPAPTPTSITAPATGQNGASSLGGIVLSDEGTGHLSQSSGGQTMKMKDLQDLLSGYGSAEYDIAAHPDVTVYEGNTMDSDGQKRCHVTYLMPLRDAEQLLFKNKGIALVTKAVAPGFPNGLLIHTYDIRFGIYNRLCILTDNAKPDPQVVSILLKAQIVNFYPASPPFVKLEKNWHTYDYMNAENKGQPGQIIDTRVNDLRSRGKFILVNMTSGYMEPHILPPGVVYKPARNSPKETSTWYVPEPLIKLILYSIEQQIGH